MKWQRKISNGCWSPNRISKSFGKREFWFHWISKKKNKTLGKYLCRKLRYRHIPFLKLKGPWLKNWTKMNKCIEGGHRNGYLAWSKVRGCSLQYIDYPLMYSPYQMFKIIKDKGNVSHGNTIFLSIKIAIKWSK